MKVLVIAGKPLKEPVVAQGRFVVNTSEQIKEAYQVLRAGKFGEWLSKLKNHSFKTYLQIKVSIPSAFADFRDEEEY